MKFQKTNIEIRINIFDKLSMYVRVCHFPAKTNSFDFFSQNLPKNEFRVRNSENYCQNKNQHPRYTICDNFESKWTTLNFFVQTCPKKDLGFKIQKTNVGTRINNLEITCVPIFRQNKQLWRFWPKFAQKWI